MSLWVSMAINIMFLNYVLVGKCIMKVRDFKLFSIIQL